MQTNTLLDLHAQAGIAHKLDLAQVFNNPAYYLHICDCTGDCPLTSSQVLSHGVVISSLTGDGTGCRHNLTYIQANDLGLQNIST